jgi:hypothetical protein
MDIKSIIANIVEKKLKKDSDDPCWDGYVQLGMKKKDGKEVPNCVPKGSVELDEAQIDKMKKISKGFSTRAAAQRENDHLVGSGKASKESYVHSENGKYFVVDMKESTQIDEISNRLVQKVRNRAADRIAGGVGKIEKDPKTGLSKYISPTEDEKALAQKGVKSFRATSRTIDRNMQKKESVKLDEQRYSLKSLKSLYGHDSKWSSRKAAENQSKRFADDLIYYGIDKDPKIDISKVGSDWKWTYVKESVELDEDSKFKRMKKDPWTPDAPIPKEFYKNGKLVKSKKYYDWVDSFKKNEVLDEDVHNDLNDVIIEFQRKLMRLTRQLDPAIAKEVKKIDKDLDDLRTGPLFKIRPGR